MRDLGSFLMLAEWSVKKFTLRVCLSDDFMVVSLSPATMLIYNCILCLLEGVDQMLDHVFSLGSSLLYVGLCYSIYHTS